MKILNKRRCIATHKNLPKNEMIRIVKTKDGKFLIDSDAPGRGAYMTKDINLFDKVIRQRLLNKTFRTNVNNNVYDDLKKKLEEE